MKKHLLPCLIVWILYGCFNSKPGPEAESVASAPLINYSVKQYYPHDTTLFTEGLLIYNGQLLESTGSPDELPHTKSTIGVSDLVTGKFIQKIELDKTIYFGEGIAVLNNKLYQITYKNQQGFVYDARSFKRIGQFSYPNREGWGLTTNNNDLIMSDGTENITFLNPQTLKPFKTIKVTENDFPIDKLNELEFINGYLYANIWMTNYIVKIDPSNGKVVAKLDLGTLAYEAKLKNPGADVLNGIAYDPATDKIYVTGKFWPNIYQIAFAH